MPRPARRAAARISDHADADSGTLGLIEMWIENPDGIRIVLVEVPADHPLRRDLRLALPPTLRALHR
jgi:hypothetical protein